MVIAAPGHRLANSDVARFDEFENEVLILREVGSGTRAAVERHFVAHDINYRPGCELSTNEAVKQAVQAGLGIGIVPAQTIELELETERLRVLRMESFPIMRQWFILYRNDKKMSAAAQTFRHMLLQLGVVNGKPVSARPGQL